jgi:hypothetical protein
MRSACLCAITAVILITGCSKKKGSPDPDSLHGDWRLLHYSGGFAGVLVHVPPDSLVILSLSANSTFAQLVNRKISWSGFYSTAYIKNGGPGPDSAWALLFSNRTAVTLFYNLDHDTLNLSEGVWDGFTYTFIRQ